MQALGIMLGVGWYITGLIGSSVFAGKGYSQSAHTYLWGAMLGPIHLFLATVAPGRNAAIRRSLVAKVRPESLANSSAPAAPSAPQPKINAELFVETTMASRRAVERELALFLDYLRKQMPHSVDGVRKHLLSYYLGCIDVLTRAVRGEGVLGHEASRLSRLDVNQLHDLLAGLHAEEVIRNVAGRDDARQIATVYLDGVASIYRKPNSFAEKWLEFLDANPYTANDTFAVRLSFRCFDDVGAALGDSRFDPDASLVWSKAGVEILKAQRRVLESISDPTFHRERFMIVSPSRLRDFRFESRREFAR